MAKKWTFSEEKADIEKELNSRGDLSTKEKQKLADRIDAYHAACKKLFKVEEDEMKKTTPNGYPMVCCHNSFEYELRKLKEEITPFAEYKDKVKKRLSELDADDDY